MFEIQDDGDHYVLRIPKESAPSSSGKTIVIGSTHGNKRTDLTVEKRYVYASVNLYYYPEDKR